MQAATGMANGGQYKGTGDPKTKSAPLQLHQVPIQPATLKNTFTFPWGKGD